MNQAMPKSMYSPKQVGAATFLGGPFAGAHLLWSNFVVLGKTREAKLTAIASAVLFIVLLVLGFLVPSKGAAGGMLIALILAISAEQITNIYQLKKAAIANSPEYGFQSNWKVFGIIVTWAILTLLLVFIVAFILTMAGVNLQD